MEELYHHGILGQKWGVRRYQNYDGTLTRAGLKRYNESLGEYEKKKATYKDAKERYRNGELTKGELTNKRVGLRKAERQVKKDYKHLKQDKLADQGKELYSMGQTITDNRRLNAAIYETSTAATFIAGALGRSGAITANTYRTIVGAATVASGAAFVKQHFYDNPNNKKLRAYYTHTSKY